MTENTQANLGQHRTRDQFVLSFFVGGALVPLALMTFGWLARTTNAIGIIDGHTSMARWAFLWIIWPTWMLMLDAEHTGTIIFMLLLSAALNGAWYARAAWISWRIGSSVKRVVESGAHRST